MRPIKHRSLRDKPQPCICREHGGLRRPDGRQHGRQTVCEGRRYRCPGCKRWVPWCFGASDDRSEICDDCYALATATETSP